MTVTGGDNSWFIKFHNISSDIRKCETLIKIDTIDVDKIMQYFITHDKAQTFGLETKTETTTNIYVRKDEDRDQHFVFKTDILCL